MAGAAPPPAGPPSEYEPFLEVALSAAREAGAVIAAAWNAPKKIDTKSGGWVLRWLAGVWGAAPPPPPAVACAAAALQPAPTRSSTPAAPGDADLVTETDKRCEALVLGAHPRRLPRPQVHRRGGVGGAGLHG